MRLRIFIEKDTAIAAIRNALSYGESITNINHFKQCVRNYVAQYGDSSKDDHLCEGVTEQQKAESVRIVNKYYGK